MKYILLLLMLCSFNLNAQKDYFQVISCKGDVVHQVSDDEALTVLPGAKIQAKGKLVLKKGSTIKLIAKDRPQKLQSEGVYDLNEMYYSADISTMSFTGKFWNYLMDGLSNTDSKADVKKYGTQRASGGIKGYNEAADSGIKPTSPIYGKISKKQLTFTWSTELKDESKFVLMNSKKKVLFEKVLRDNVFTVDLENINAKAGKYSWQVFIGEAMSPKIGFTYEPINRDKMNAKLGRISDYVEGDALEKSWIEAVVLEMEGFEYEAGLKYDQLMQDNPNHLLFQKLYMLYLARNGRMDKALSFTNDKR